MCINLIHWWKKVCPSVVAVSQPFSSPETSSPSPLSRSLIPAANGSGRMCLFNGKWCQVFSLRVWHDRCAPLLAVPAVCQPCECPEVTDWVSWQPDKAPVWPSHFSGVRTAEWHHLNHTHSLESFSHTHWTSWSIFHTFASSHSHKREDARMCVHSLKRLAFLIATSCCEYQRTVFVYSPACLISCELISDVMLLQRSDGPDSLSGARGTCAHIWCVRLNRQDSVFKMFAIYC